MKSIDIFIKSYKPDFWLLALALETIKKNVTGYTNLILLIPETDKHDFDTRNLPERTLVHYVTDKFPGWLGQQVFKLQAYNYCFSEFILFTDSDAFFCKPIDLQDIIADWKPEILYTNYNELPDAIIWKPYVENFIREPVEYEFMRRLPLTYHRSTLTAIGDYEPNLESIIMHSDRFSEFNIMGAYAWKFEREKYRFRNTNDWVYVPPIAKQIWSHASKTEGSDELHLREYIRTLETIMEAFGVPIP